MDESHRDIAGLQKELVAILPSLNKSDLNRTKLTTLHLYSV